MHRTHSAAVLGYVPAVAHFGATCYVDLYATHPDTGALRRKRYKVNHVKGAAARKAYARDLCDKLNAQLRRGWNPWQKDQGPKSMRSVKEVLAEFERFKLRTTHHTSPHNYLMASRRFREYAARHGLLDAPIGSITRHQASHYMDELLGMRAINNNTFNVYLQFVKGMFYWLSDRGYIGENPFARIRRMRRITKVKQYITPDERAAAIAWFRVNDPPMVLICMCVFHTLIRPRAELRRVRVGWIDAAAQVIRFDDGRSTKSGTHRHPAIPPNMMEELRASGVLDAPPQWYLVGRGLRPGPAPIGANTIGLRWNAMRNALGWPAGKQLASLRDTGIVQMLRDGISPEVIMRQADHKSIATTNAYLQHSFEHAHGEVIAKASPL